MNNLVQGEDLHAVAALSIGLSPSPAYCQLTFTGNNCHTRHPNSNEKVSHVDSRTRSTASFRAIKNDRWTLARVGVGFPDGRGFPDMMSFCIKEKNS